MHCKAWAQDTDILDLSHDSLDLAWERHGLFIAVCAGCRILPFPVANATISDFEVSRPRYLFNFVDRAWGLCMHWDWMIPLFQI